MFSEADEKDAKEKDTKDSAGESKPVEEDIVVVKKLVPKTVYPQLLLAFSFFDRSFSGYIKQRDLEDCIDALGVGLSKQQVEKTAFNLVFKIVIRFIF